MSNSEQSQVRNAILQNKIRYLNQCCAENIDDTDSSLSSPMWDKRMLTGQKPKKIQSSPNTISHSACNVSSSSLFKMRARCLLARLFDV